MRKDDHLYLIIITESRNDADIFINRLRNHGYSVRPLRIDSELRLNNALRDQNWDLILYLMQDELDLEFTTVMNSINDSGKDIPIIVVADNFSPVQKLEWLENGANDIVPSEPMGLLKQAVNREINGLQLRRNLKTCQDTLRETENYNRILINNARDAIAYVQEGAHIFANPAYLQLFKFNDVEEIIGVPLLDMLHNSAHLAFKGLLRILETANENNNNQYLETQGLRTNGELFLARFEISSTVLDGENCIQVTVHDLSQNNIVQDQINDIINRDFLTGLYNRQYFIQALERNLSNRPGVIYLTIDNLIVLRNKLGISATDQLIKKIATLITSQTDPNDLVANFNDGIFTILTVQGEEAHLNNLSETLKKKITHESFDINGINVNVMITISFYHANLQIQDTQSILSKLELTASTAREGKGTTILACGDDSKTSNLNDDINIVKNAMNNNKILFLYQPIVYLRGDGRELYEVFPKIIGQNGAQAIPEQIMLLNDENHLPTNVDRWILSQILSIMANRQAQSNKVINNSNKSVNILISLSLDSVLDETFINWLGGKLKSLNILPASLIFKIDVNLVNDHYRRLRTFIPALHGLGCWFALSNYQIATLTSQLGQLNIDYFKFDGKIIKDLANNRDYQSLVRTINEQVHELGKYTLAESVRDANTLSLLWQYGVDYIQGEYLQQPSENMDYDFSNLFIE